MKFDLLLSDVNLSKIVFDEASAKVVISFLNMQDGGEAGTLVCDGLLVFSYQVLPESGLPQYVGEVNDALVSSDEASAVLQHLQYGFKDSRGETVIPPIREIHQVRIEGGVSIHIVCAKVYLFSQEKVTQS